MQRGVALIVVATACGGGDRAVHPAVAPAATDSPGLAQLRDALPPGPRCMAAGTRIAMLDGAVTKEDAADPEVTLARLCERDAWPLDITDCASNARDVVEADLCVQHLPPKPRDAVAKLRDTWVPDDLAALLAGARPTRSPPAPDTIRAAASVDDAPECTSVLAEPAWLPPAVPIAAPDRSWTSALRGVAVVAECASWPAAERKCFAGAVDAAAVAACAHDAADAVKLGEAIGAADALVGKLANLRAHAAAITCERVVDAHYRDAAWRGKLDELPQDERRTLIAGSRTAMAKACSADSWSADLRACLVADGGDVCFTAAGVPGAIWGYPAIGVFLRRPGSPRATPTPARRPG